MVELFIMEYLTVLYMIMASLFMDSRYSRRRTVFIVSTVAPYGNAAATVPTGEKDRFLPVANKTDRIGTEAAARRRLFFHITGKAAFQLVCFFRS